MLTAGEPALIGLVTDIRGAGPVTAGVYFHHTVCR